MKKILLAVALGLLSAAAQAQIWISVPAAWVRMDGGDPAGGSSGGGAPEDAEYLLCTADAGLANAFTLASGMCSFMVAGTSSTLSSAMTNETGAGTPGQLMFNTGPVLSNGGSGGGYIDFAEDTDNGSNRFRILGANSQLSDINARLATNNAANDVYADGYEMPIGFDPSTQFRFYEEFNCGVAATVTANGNCNLLRMTGTNGGTVNGSVTACGTNAAGCIPLNTVDADGVATVTTTNQAAMILVDGMHGKFRVVNTVAYTSGGAGINGRTDVGSHDGSATVCLTVPTNGIWFSYTEASANWQINVANGSTTSADSGVAVTFDPTVTYTMVTLEYYYNSTDGVHFYVNGTETSNSPINSTLPTSPNSDEFSVVNLRSCRTGGSDATATSLIVDYVFVEGKLAR